MTTSNKQSTVRLRPMTDEEYVLWLPRQTAAYAAAKVKSGNWSAADSKKLATSQMRELLPDGLKTKDHRIFSIESTDTNEVVGVLWIHVRPSAQGQSAFIYDIEVDERYRGQGFGSCALTLLEEKLRRAGIKSLQLHVFGYNVAAQRLYQRLGFEVTNINMAKEL